MPNRLATSFGVTAIAQEMPEGSHGRRVPTSFEVAWPRHSREVMDMAATNPKEEPQQGERQYGRPTLAKGPTASAHRSRWIAIAIGIVILAAIGVVAYMLLYNGNGGGGSGNGGGGGGLYGFALTLSSDGVRRLKTVISRCR